MKTRGIPSLFSLLAAAVVSGGLAGAVHAQTYPSKPIRIIAPYAAGTPGDVVLRMVAEKMRERLGQPVVVDNRPGANTIIGMEAGAKSPPDGYTLIHTPDAAMVANPSLYSKLSYDPIRNFDPVTVLGSWTQFLLVHESVPATSLKELIALAKAKPGSLTYASSGNGSSQHINFEAFKRAAGIDIAHVPYKGVADAARDFLGGQVSMFILPDGFVAPHIKSGKVRALAVAGVDPKAHSPFFPAVPTYAEAGLPEFEPLASWTVMLAVAGTPKDIVARLHGEVVGIMRSQEIRERLAAIGVAASVSNSPQESADFIRTQGIRWAKAIGEVGVKLD